MNWFARKRIDQSIPLVGIGLSVFGLVMILSSSQIVAAEHYSGPFYFFTRQLIFWFLGIGAYLFFVSLPLLRLYEARKKVLIGAVVMLILVLIPFFGPEVAGVHRWLGWGPFRFQPAEFVKLLSIIGLAGLLAERQGQINNPKQGLIPFALGLGVLLGLIMLEPDMGTAVIISVVAMAMFFASGINLGQYLALIFLGLVIFLALIQAAPYRAQRLTVFLNRTPSEEEKLGDSYHVNQALIAIGSGGWWGAGFGQGTSKYAYLPESYTDSIFAVVAEELGFIRSALLMLLFGFLAWRGLMIAEATHNRFASLIAVGVATLFISQALINVAGMLHVLPLTGVPLPFVSYGGSSLIVSLSALGLLVNISRHQG